MTDDYLNRALSRRRFLKLAGGGLAAASLVPILAACGGSSSSSSATTAADTGSAGGGGSEVTVTMGSPDEYSMVPDPTAVSAGSVTFHVVNNGAMEHEMVIVKTDKGAANLGDANGEADETGAVDEIVLAAGASGDLTVDLAAGKYALVCNLPGHYAAGMYADFTVN